MDNDKLLPCPFCEGKASLSSEYDPDGCGSFYFIQCYKCRSRSGNKFASTGNFCGQMHQELRDEWNTRPAIRPQLKITLQEKIGDLEAVLSKCSWTLFGLPQIRGVKLPKEVKASLQKRLQEINDVVSAPTPPSEQKARVE